MGIGKKVAENKAKKVVEGATADIPIVGGMVDENVKSGPMDRAGDSVDKSRKKLDKKKDKMTKGRDDKGLLGRK